MGENTKIEWCDHSWNPWQGCLKISPGCQHCYAETLSNRWGRDIWGPGPKRQRTSPANWQKPIQWNRRAGQEGRRFKVFCASMGDIFEDNQQLDGWRLDLWGLIKETPNLDWLLLTKRPENICEMTRFVFSGFGDREWALPPNIWIGTSVENQEYADKRIPELLKIPASTRFLSCEPLLGPLNIQRYLLDGWHKFQPKLHWVIVGGESGHGARPMDVKWVKDLVDRCKETGTAVFVKQLGAKPYSMGNSGLSWSGGTNFTYLDESDPRNFIRLKDKKGGDPAEWPVELRAREFPVTELDF